MMSDKVQNLDPQEAFESALRGFSELVRLEPTLDKFQQTLFSESTKTFNRDMETSHSVEKLDTVIAEFLHLISPYFLLRSSHRCLQWLMYTFEIHNYNTDSLMECVLPYYQSTLFSRVVDNLKVPTESRWFWLCETFKPEMNLSSSTLVNWCIKKKWLVVFISDMTLASIKTHKKYGCASKGPLKNLLSLYCCTIVGIMETDRNISKSFLLSILPYLLKGLKSSNHDFKCSTIIIISVLGIKASLDKELMHTLLTLLSKVYKSSLSEEATLCVRALSMNFVYSDDCFPEKCPPIFKDILCSDHTEDVSEIKPSQENMIMHEPEHIPTVSLLDQLKTLSDNVKRELRCGEITSSSLEQFVKHITSKATINNILMDTQHESVMKIIYSMIRDIPPPAALSTNLWLNTPYAPVVGSTDPENMYYFFIVAMFKFSIAVNNHKGKKILQKLFKFHFGGKGSLLRFLAMIWNAALLSCSSIITADLQVHALGVAAAYIQSRDSSAITALTAPSCPVIPSLLLGLGSPVKAIRKGCLKCMSILHNAAPSISSEPLCSFLEAIISCVCELEADEYAITIFLEKYFCTPSSQCRVSKNKRSKTMDNRLDVLECLFNWFSSLCSVEGQSPPHYVMLRFLLIFREVNTEKKLLLLLPCLEKVIAEIQNPNKDLMEIADQSSLCNVLSALVSCYNPVTATCLSKESALFGVLLDMLSINNTPLIPVSPCALVLKQITPQFFQHVDLECQKCLFTTLLDMLLESKSSTMTTLLKNCLKHLLYSSEMVIEELTGLDSMFANTQMISVVDSTLSRKRHRKSKVMNPSLTFNRIVALLEIVHSSQQTINDQLLFVPILFKILSLCLNIDDNIMNSQDLSLVTTIDYIQQLALDILFFIYESINQSNSQSNMTESMFNIEVLIQTLQTSSNIKIQHSVLLLLSTALALFPTRNIHDIMPVFAFIGQSLSNQDNEVTFDVITRTITAIMPPLIKHSSQKVTHRRRSSPQLDPVLSTVTDVFRVMVDSLPHIPHHRSLPLLTNLIDVVDPVMFLHVLLGLVIAKCVTISTEPKSSSFDGWNDARFLVSLSESFNSSVQLYTVLKLLQYVTALPHNKPDASEARRIPLTKTYLFDICHNSHKQLKQFRYAVLSSLTAIAGNIRLDYNNRSVETTEYIENIVKHCLEYLITLTDILKTTSDVVTTKYWEAITKRVNSVCEKVVGILPFDELLSTLIKLMTCDNNTVQWRTIKILNKIMEKSSDMFSKKEEHSILKLVKLLEDVSTNSLTSNIEKQTALYGIKLIVGRTDKKSKAFSKTAKTLVYLLSNESLDSLVKSNTFLCLAELCQYMSVDMIKLLPRIIPHLLNSIDQSNSYLCLSSLVTIGVMIKNVPTVTSFLHDILAKTCAITNDNSSSTEIVDQAKFIRINISVLFPSRVLLPIIHKTLPPVITGNKDSTHSLVDVFDAVVSRIQKQDMKSSLTVVTDIFLLLFEYRSIHEQIPNHDNILYMEERVNAIFCNFAMKLSEVSFKPLFTQFLDWASEESLTSDKIITFCHLTKYMSQTFKGLFLLFANPLVIPFGNIIDMCHLNKDQEVAFKDSPHASSQSKASLTLQYVLTTLTTCFLHDTQQSFVTKETFEYILQPLINQISNTNDSNYQQMIERHLAPCLSQLAVAAGKDGLWKALNHSLLMKTRDKHAKVRFASLLVATELYSKLGEETSILLPETIPFLSELLEDESLEVEQQVKVTISKIEEVTRESVQQYF